MIYFFSMNYYVVQVSTGKENLFVESGEKNEAEFEREYSIIFPQRVLKIKKSGKFTEKKAAVFPGYVFIRSEEITPDTYHSVRKLKGFYRFLPNNQEPLPLKGKDLDILKHFISFGCVANISVAVFDENDRIQILDGPLKGLEGQIIKVDRRKGRAKVKLDMYQNSFAIDFGFTQLSQMGKKREDINDKSSD